MFHPGRALPAAEHPALPATLAASGQMLPTAPKILTRSSTTKRLPSTADIAIPTPNAALPLDGLPTVGLKRRSRLPMSSALGQKTTNALIGARDRVIGCARHQQAPKGPPPSLPPAVVTWHVVTWHKFRELRAMGCGVSWEWLKRRPLVLSTPFWSDFTCMFPDCIWDLSSLVFGPCRHQRSLVNWSLEAKTRRIPAMPGVSRAAT